MNPLLQPVVESLVDWLRVYEVEQSPSYLHPLRVQIMGQLGLILHPDPRLQKLPLAATRDLDAVFKGPYPVAKKMKALFFEKQQLVWDIDSEKIWLPTASTYTEILSLPKLHISVLDPLYALTSKAIKAREKNRILIRQALPIFDPELSQLIQAYGGNPDDFR